MRRYATLVEIDSLGLHTALSPLNRRAAVASGLRLTVHGPYGYGIDPGSPDEALRRRTVALHRRHIEAAVEIGALLYVAHADYREPPGPRDPAVVAALQPTIADLAEIQRELGMRIAVENLPGVGSSHFTAPGDLELGELGFALDTGHAAISGTLDAFLADPQARLIHVHLHSNFGPVDADDPHRPLGEGVVDAAPPCWPSPARPGRPSSSSTSTNRRPWRASPGSRRGDSPRVSEPGRAGSAEAAGQRSGFSGSFAPAPR